MSRAEVVRFGSEPILGWRAWHVRYADGLPESPLSISHPLRWPARRPMRAHCLYAWKQSRLWGRLALSGHGTAPSLGHSCGIYATRTPAQARSWSRHFAQEGADAQRIIGRVSLWGRVLEHTHSRRAELAYPAEFVLPPTLAGGRDPEALAFWLESLYGVSATTGGELWERSRPRSVLGRLGTLVAGGVGRVASRARS